MTWEASYIAICSTLHWLYAWLWLVPLALLFGIWLTILYYAHQRKGVAFTSFGWWVVFCLLCLGLAGLSHWCADYFKLGF